MKKWSTTTAEDLRAGNTISVGDTMALVRWRKWDERASTWEVMTDRGVFRLGHTESVEVYR